MFAIALIAGALLPLLTPIMTPEVKTPAVEVDGAHLVDGEGSPIQLRGVNRSGTEYSCVQGHGIFDGPVDDTAIAAMASWEVNTVRVPLNEDCWLGAPGLDPSLSGARYRDAVVDYVRRLNASGIVVILDLHWTGTGDDIAREQQPMARAGRSPRFWGSVANVFLDRRGVMFDVFNEPHDVSWNCWRDGCGTHAGMQDLVDAIRSTGASQPIIISGLDWGGDLRRWRQFLPDDPLDRLIAGVHLYDFKRCGSTECWEAEIAPVAADTPVVITEFGDSDCDADFSQKMMSWADSVQVSYVAWAWNPWDCGGGPALISSFDGSATRYGQVIRDRFIARTPPPETPHRMPVGAIPE